MIKRISKKLSLLIVAEEETEAFQPVAQNQISAADEILKFKKLLDDGILTKEEFDAKKKQLLGI
ncbi:SHOCT domain-containing protein [Lysinibacillus xylanilyticus]|uniref:SHOCT domain-containing protein n=1 Tax=Lysinibacillus xylanilyticus TaxID=582475 RepID=UPI003806972D